MAPGTIVLINGASSSGKSTLLDALQGLLEQPFLNASLDKFLWMLPKRYFAQPLWNEVMGHADRAGPAGQRLVSGMHQAIAALARVGSHVIADHVLIEPDWLADCARAWRGLPIVFVGLVCPLDVLEARERTRKDRTLGQARLQFDRVHRDANDDLVIDSSHASAQEAALRIIRHLKEAGPNFAFNQGRAAAGLALPAQPALP
jgi:chloramphenicol 3-O phosphotransferase